jgi:hypothetical protein
VNGECFTCRSVKIKRILLLSGPEWGMLILKLSRDTAGFVTEWGILHMNFGRDKHRCYDSRHINWGQLF